MIFVFAEDATLSIAADVDAVRRMCEPIDVESGVFQFYDADGRPLAPRFTRPNRQTKIIGVVWSVTQGDFTLEPAETGGYDNISVALLETAALETTPFFADLGAVRHYLTGRGAL